MSVSPWAEEKLGVRVILDEEGKRDNKVGLCRLT
jgi:hypothetical protein